MMVFPAPPSIPARIRSRVSSSTFLAWAFNVLAAVSVSARASDAWLPAVAYLFNSNQ